MLEGLSDSGSTSAAVQDPSRLILHPESSPCQRSAPYSVGSFVLSQRGYSFTGERIGRCLDSPRPSFVYTVSHITHDVQVELNYEVCLGVMQNDFSEVLTTRHSHGEAQYHR